LGISDDRQIRGIEITNKIKLQILAIGKNCDPSIRVVIKEVEKIVLIVEVKEGINKPYQCSAGFYLRIGANSQKLSRDEILEFSIPSGKIRFDEQICPKFIFEKHFDETKFDDFLTTANISKHLPIKQVLLNMNLAREEDKNFYVNNACVLLFSKHLSDIYYHTKITCVRFKGDTRVKIIDKKDFNQDILSNIENAINFLKQYIPLEFIIEDVRRKERYAIPIPVLREAVVHPVRYFK
jgi:ATP-dependent DNA helicase RecG